MLRYITLGFENPLKPAIRAIRVRALVAGNEAALMLPPRLAQQLQLEAAGTRQVMLHESGAQPVTYVGPVKLTAGAQTVFSGAILFGEEIILGEPLAQELCLEKRSAESVASPEPTKPSLVLPAASSVSREIIAAASLPRQHDLTYLTDASYIMQVENFIDAETCRMICDYAATQKRARLGVVDPEKTTSKKLISKVDPKLRDTFYVPTAGIDDMLREMFYNIYAQQVEPFFGVKIEWWEKAQMLCYYKGGRYDPHADADQWVPDAKGGGMWKPNMDRDVSVLLYVNDDFTGGALRFPNHDLRIQPKPGLLVAFPSHAHYLHGAEPTESGTRYALVSWAAAKGTPRLRGAPQASIYMSEFAHAS